MRIAKRTCFLFFPCFLFSVFCFLSFIDPASAQFVTGGEPAVTDELGNADGGTPVFSPNNDGIQERVVITFRPSVDKGDFLVIVDTHGPGGVGKADGTFHNLLPVTSSDDWAFLGSITTTDIKRLEWDGKDRNTPTAKFADEGTYNILVELDNVADGKVDRAAASYASRILTVKIDVTKPTVAVSTEPFSPNGDGQKDVGFINFGLSEDLFEDAKLEFDKPIPELLSVFPKIVGEGKSKGPHTATWDGKDSTGKIVAEASYAIKVSAADFGGNVGTATTSIFVDFTAPKVISTSPKEGATNNNNLEIASVSAVLDDGSGSGFNFTKNPPTIRLLNAANVDVLGTQSLDEATKTLTWKLNKPLISTADNGLYTILVRAVDQASNSLSGGETKIIFIYDTQAPKINSVVSGSTALKVGDANTSLPATATITITLSDLGGSGVNFGATSVQLLSPTNAIQPTRKTTDGVNTITVDYEVLQQQGLYTLRLSAVDKAANATGNLDFPFKYDIDPPNITSILAGTSAIDLNSSLSFVNSQLDKVTVVLKDVNNLSEIDFTKSSLRLKDSSGAIIAGVQENNVIDTIIWRLNSILPKDGSKDGNYTIAVEAFDKVGNKIAKEFKITYDTKAPEIKSVSPQDKSILKVAISSVTVTATDGAGSGIDFSKSSLKLLSPAGSTVSSQQSNNASDTISLSFTSITQSGKYILEANLTDKAGNSVTKQFSFDYIIESPKVISISPANKSKLNQFVEVKATLQDNSGLGIDFAATVIKLTSPTNQQIDGLISNNGKDEIKLSLISSLLTDGSDDGNYTVQVTPKDKAGAVGLQAQSVFTYDTQRPLLSSLTVGSTSIDLTSTTLFVGGVVDKIAAALQDKDNRSEIDLGKSTISLKDAKGIVIAGVQEDNSTNIITWRLTSALPRDGSKDGTYLVDVVAFDKASNSLAKQYSVVYDSKAPESLEVNPADKSSVKGSLSSVSLTLSDGQGSGISGISGIDFSKSTLKLLSPTNQPISALSSSNGVDKIILSFSALSASGRYTIEANLTDRAGNSSAKQFTFDYAIEAIAVLSITPPDNSKVNQLEQIKVTLQTSGIGLDFSATTLKLLNAKNEPISGIASNNGKDEITLTLTNPLPKNGSADGNYVIELVVSDQAGRKETKRFATFYDTQPPSLVSSLPAAAATVTQSLSQISLTLTDGSGSGVDLSATAVKFMSPTAQAISVARSDNGKDTIFLDFAPLKTDGSADGIYSLEVTPQDRAKNAAPTRKLEFVYLAKVLELITTIPEAGAFINQLSSVEAELKNLAATTDFDKSSVVLKDSKGNEQKGRQVINGTKLRLDLERSLPTDGSADGTYSLSLNIVDKSGQVTTQNRSFVYDSLPPSILDSNPADKATIKKDISSVVISVTDGSGSGLDLAASTLHLSLGTQAISAQQSSDGAGKITLSFSGLPQVGKYTLDVVLVDKAKNRLNRQLSFDYSIDSPKVISVFPENRGKVRNVTFVSAVLQDNSGKGLDFSGTGSSIKLLEANNRELDGTISNDGKSEIKLSLSTPLATDGSDDGVYTIMATPKDKSGTQGLQRQFTFTYDSQAPEVTSISFVDLTSLLTNVSQEILKLEAVLNDGSGTGVDVKKSSLRLKNKDGKIVDGKQTDDDKSKIRWELNQPLPRDGSADGRYTVELSAFDQAGNSEAKPYEILYDTQIPTVLSTLPASGSSVKPPFKQISVKLSDGSGSGVDLSGTSVQLIGSKGAVGANKFANGTDTIFLSFDALKIDGSDDGSYRIEVLPKDRAGNLAISALKFEFSYLTENPGVTSTVPADLSFVNQIGIIAATLEDRSGKGIDLEKSTIRLKAPDGKEVEGRQTDDKSKTITWLLPRPLPTDGSADGEYTIAIKAADKASNSAEYQKKFSYDTSIPKLVKITPVDATTITGSLNEITIVLNDGKGSGVNASGTLITLKSPSGDNIPGNKSDNGVDTLKFTFRDLTESGTYIIEITPKDLAGNISAHPIQSRFSLVSKPPVVTSVSVIEKEFVNNLDEIVMTIEDRSGVGINLSATTVKVVGPKGEIEGEISAQSAIRWRPIVPLKKDGSDDGNYSITITPVDNAGRTGQSRQRTVVYDTQSPEVISASPVNINAPLTYVGSQISLVEAQIKDFGPSGLEISDQQVRLLNANGAVVSGVQSDDGKDKVSWQLTKPLPTDGKADAPYSVLVVAVDKAGNKKEFRYRLIYDTQAPQMVKVTPPDKEVIAGDLTSIVVQLKDTGDGLIDFEASKIRLIDPNNKSVVGSLSNNGEDQITLKFSSLELDGSYNVEVSAIDKAGNGLNSPTKTSFLFSTGLPIVLSTLPATIPSDKAFENKRLAKVEAKLQETNNGGINLAPTGSEIRLKDPNGNIVAGNQTNNNVDTIIWNLARPLEPDGASDGSYVISITPINRAGRKGVTQNFNFVYDTVAPKVRTEDIKIILSGGALSEISAIVTDEAPSSTIDWDNADSSWIKLVDSKGKAFSGRVTNDKSKTLGLKLDVPLASNGTQDGIYKVILAPKDKAGNVPKGLEYEFVYDTKPPTLISEALTINDHPLIVDTNAEDYPTAVSSQGGAVITAKFKDEGQGVDLTASTITVLDPSKQPVSGTFQQNGVDTLQFTSGFLSAQGTYSVSIKAVGLDKANLGIKPSETVSTTFILETTKPSASLTSFGTKKVLKDEAAPLKGTAIDKAAGNIPASGVALVEIGGEGPNGALKWLAAEDESAENQESWSQWKFDFLPNASGEYEVKIRVTDEAGNSAIFDAVTLDFSVSLSFTAKSFVWPNPVNFSQGEEAHFSFVLNIPSASSATVRLSIYDISGDLIYSSDETNVKSGAGRLNDLLVWDGKNQSGEPVASGIYIYRLEASDGKSRTHKVGRFLVVRK